MTKKASRLCSLVALQATDLLAEIEGIKGFSVLALDWVAEDEVPTLSIEHLGNPSSTDSLTARVAWNVGQNKLVGDAVRRSAAKFPLKVILHQSQSLLARLLLIMRNWPDTLSAWREKKQDPDAYAINLVKHKEVFRKLMEHAISLIVVDEAAQLAENLSLAKNKYQYLLNEVTAAELPKSLVDVRTIIDDSFSPEADQVFIDLI
ncbi:uncharacterized protein Y057_9301 [Fusarium fujikuroi]|nr:uncharacterized protein Y057_9301 [Fusarium fujikuroi]